MPLCDTPDVIISAFVQRLFLGIQSAVAYYHLRKASQSFDFTQDSLQLAKRTPIGTYIAIFLTYNRYQLRSGQQSKLRLKCLVQGSNRLAVASARTYNIDGLLNMSPALFHQSTCALVAMAGASVYLTTTYTNFWAKMRMVY